MTYTCTCALTTDQHGFWRICGHKCRSNHRLCSGRLRPPALLHRGLLLLLFRLLQLSLCWVLRLALLPSLLLQAQALEKPTRPMPKVSRLPQAFWWGGGGKGLCWMLQLLRQWAMWLGRTDVLGRACRTWYPLPLAIILLILLAKARSWLLLLLPYIASTVIFKILYTYTSLVPRPCGNEATHVHDCVYTTSASPVLNVIHCSIGRFLIRAYCRTASSPH